MEGEIRVEREIRGERREVATTTGSTTTTKLARITITRITLIRLTLRTK